MWDLGLSVCGERLFTFIPLFQLSVFKINSGVGFSLLCVFALVLLPLIKLMSLEMV